MANVVSVDVSAFLTTELTRVVMARPPRKSTSIPDGDPITQRVVLVTDTSTLTITGIKNFLIVEASADLNVQVRQTGGILQSLTVRGLFVLFGSIGEVVVAAPSTTAVEVRIYHS